MKQKVGIAAIIVGVIVLAGFMFAIYKMAFQQQSPEPSAASAPGYVKQAQAAAAGGGAPSDYGNTYRQGGAQSPGGGVNMGRAAQSGQGSSSGSMPGASGGMAPGSR
jgi:hypothetical protein